jgi:hypothetical protein
MAAGAVCAQSWTQANPVTTPTFRRAGAMAYDGVGNRLLMHGGLDPSFSSLIDETWAYNGITWTLLTPTSGMAGRWGHQLVRDTLRNRLITFGGRSPTQNTPANDTYQWNGSGWLQILPASAPAPRHLYGMAYDQRRDRVVVFGGRGALQTLSDTWEFEGSNWQRVDLLEAPPARQELVMVYDAGRAATVLFGGFHPDSSTVYGDTWEYDGSQWVERSFATPPAPRYRAAAAYDSRRQRVLVYGGFNGQNLLTQTLEFTGDEWRQLPIAAGSQFATEQYAGFDPQRNRFVTFGGFGASFGNQTWEFTGANGAIFGSFGHGCPTSAGIATIQASAPRLGQSFDLVAAPIPGNTTFVLFAQGYSANTFNGGPLPLSLAPFGLPDCALEVAGIGTYGVVVGTGAGSAGFGFTIPNLPGLLNVLYYVQAFIPDAAVTNRIGGLSRPARAVIGN